MDKPIIVKPNLRPPCGCPATVIGLHSNKVPVTGIPAVRTPGASARKAKRPAQWVRGMCIWLGLLSTAVAATPDPLFTDHTPLDISLTAPFSTIDRDRDKDAEYGGSLSYVAAGGETVTLEVTLQVRGNFRLRTDICRYSQLWVDFRRRQTQGTIFENQNRIKLVVQCRSGDRYQESIAKQHQAYQMYKQLSDLSLDTRLANTTFVDSESSESRTSLTMFIEHQRRLSERSGLAEVEENTVLRSSLHPEQASMVALFMMMIGNTDFSLVAGPPDEECCHNAKLLVDEQGAFHPVPYDFDISGFVNAAYAPEPDPSLGIRNNRQRLFRGYCDQNDSLAAAITRFNQAREAVMDIAASEVLVSSRTASQSSDYLEDFFELINDPRQLERDILRRCRG